MPNEPTQTTTDGNGLPPQSTTATSPPPPSPSPPVAPGGADPLVYASDGKRWRDKFHGREGYINQLEKQLAEAQGQFAAQSDDLSQRIRERDGTIGQLTSQVENLQGQVDGIPSLLEQINQLETKSDLAEKYRMMADFPTLLGVRVEETVKDDEGNDQVVTVNPVLNLIEHTNLGSSALRDELRRLEAFYQGTSTQAPDDEPPAAPPPASPPGEPGARPPAPPSPVGPAEDTAEYWYDKATAIRQQMNEGGITPELMQAHSEAWRKHAELLVQQD